MAEIRPFQAIRPRADMAEKIAALPYDVYNRQEAKREAQKNSDSFINIDRPETQFPDEMDMYSEEVYKMAHDLLWDEISQGKFVEDDKNCYYIYELTMNGRVQTGIVACASVDDYQNGVIKKHENTRAEKELDRIHHVDACNAQTGPIFLAYRADPVIQTIVLEAKKSDPIYDFTSEDKIRHRVFVINDDANINALKKAFASIGEIYIADGHHRAASAVKVGINRREQNKEYTGNEPFNFFLSVLFPDEELMILDYNRVVKDLNGLSEHMFLSEVKERFDICKCEREERRPQCKGMFSMYLGGEWYLLKVREEDKSNDPVKGLDVSILQEKLLYPVLGIKDPKTDERIDFVGGIRGLDELEQRVDTDCEVAFAMYPTSIQELFQVADAGLLMPPKSTWFEPKLRSGLFIHRI